VWIVLKKLAPPGLSGTVEKGKQATGFAIGSSWGELEEIYLTPYVRVCPRVECMKAKG